MQKSISTVTKLFLASIAGITFASQPSFAQLGTVDAGGNNSEQQNNLDFSSGNFNMFNLIHQATFGTSSWNASQQGEQLDEAAKAFRERQNQAIGNNQQQGQTPAILPIIIKPSVTQPVVTPPAQ
ncbi:MULTISPECIES: hypothetical protein [unclassified Anabaena]|uniref:hypothetical protein n=1 Tax=unclassified Anabaena TaxID=2619674 RepID=UPI0008314824|nr:MULTISPECIES: hypothetical protein [unclassified Anabaena]